MKWFDSVKGLGVITREDGEDFLFRGSSIKSHHMQVLSIGNPVLFDIGRGQKGPEAIYVLHVKP